MKKRLAIYLSGSQKNKKGIHQQIEETLAERKGSYLSGKKYFLMKILVAQKTFMHS